MPPRSAQYWESRPLGRVRCGLCPRRCLLEEGRRGRCGARENAGGAMAIPFYGLVSSIAMDPVEKKPLSRFMPGTLTFSVGLWHCTMECPFCQNWEIAHPFPEAASKGGLSAGSLDPDALVNLACESGAPSISFTYSEPCLHAEYLLDCLPLARRRGLKTILVTNGCLEKGPAQAILDHVDASNIDLKSPSPRTYESVLGGSLEAVLRFIRLAASRCHVELTSLAVPGILDKEEEFQALGKLVAAIDPSIPLHVTCYRPAYRWRKAPLRPERVRSLAEAARPWVEDLIIHA